MEETFGSRLRKLREERGMTLQELSLKSGIHQSTISRLETDPQRRPHMETFIQLAKGFGVSIQELAILTDLIDPDSEENIVIKDEQLKTNYHLLNKENLALLKALEGIDSLTRYHLTQFITGLKKNLTEKIKTCD
ncbi:hypothetical protein BBF96_05470 [Anoxybacter fermentans]|uniref:HTH cro/C1-type domain-containing protein n=1 Tax=Anoxybacter fermentans TaxID=1323375 RepID=A0A3S9SX15_9FIRM|nr:helix-turn-helix transcriptional regulator [Anoxybacter fermentans]AZR72886.1 hypothetical protein BBF96_05470 [Anoxybacter fermentans]